MGNWCRQALRCLHRFSPVCIWLSRRGGFLPFTVGRHFFPGLVQNAEGFGHSNDLVTRVFRTRVAVLFEDAPHFDGIGDRMFCSVIDNAEDVVFMRLFSLSGENLQH